MTLDDFNRARRRLSLLSSSFMVLLVLLPAALLLDFSWACCAAMLVSLLVILLAGIRTLRLVDDFRCPGCGNNPVERRAGDASGQGFDPGVVRCVHCQHWLGDGALADAKALG